MYAYVDIYCTTQITYIFDIAFDGTSRKTR